MPDFQMPQPLLELVMTDWMARAAKAEARVAWLELALKTICGPSDSGPFIWTYRDAGGGYEGLQAIARLALEQPGDLSPQDAMWLSGALYEAAVKADPDVRLFRRGAK